MGRRGPPKTPSAVKMQRGTDQPCRMNPDEPQPEHGVPAPPSWLSDEERVHYAELAASVSRMDILTHADGEALGTLAAARHRLDLAQEACRCNPVVDDDGRRTGWAVERHAALVDYTRLLREFGLSPASRPNVCCRLAALPKLSRKYGNIVSRTRGSSGVVAL